MLPWPVRDRSVGPASRPVAATALAGSSVLEQVRVYTQRGRHLVVPMNQLSSGGRIPAATGRLAEVRRTLWNLGSGDNEAVGYLGEPVVR